MITWLRLLNNMLELGEHIARFFRERALRKQGADEAISEINNEANKKLDKALDARRSVKHDADSVRADPDNRRNR